MSDDVTEALAGAETEDTVAVLLFVPTGITLMGMPHPKLGHRGSSHEVTLSGLMEVQAILERGGLVEQGSVVNEAEEVVYKLLEGGMRGDHAYTVSIARDIVGMLAEKGLLRKGA